MKILFFLILSLFNISSVSAQIYTADLEHILISVKEYEEVNKELIQLQEELTKAKEPLLKKIKDLKNSSEYLEAILNETGRENKRRELFLLERELSLLEKEQQVVFVNKERSLKFPLIRKILGSIKNKYDKTKIDFIVDPDSIFFYKDDSTKVIDLTDEIIRTYNKKTN